jgi:hypothetical protein
MNWKRDNWTVFVATLAVTVAVLVAGQLMWQKFAVARPLDRGLKEIAGVESAVWEENKNGDVVIKVALADVPNLAKTYGDIDTAAKRVLGRRPARVVLTDRRSPELEQLYYTCHYNIQEAIATGGFTTMAERVQTAARAVGAEAKVYVDAHSVYLQLKKDGAELYAVVPRQNGNGEVM